MRSSLRCESRPRHGTWQVVKRRKLSFEKFCKKKGVELTEGQKQVWESWDKGRRLVFVGRKAGMSTLLGLMDEYDLYLKGNNDGGNK